jgi:(2Fe-2S) ferredoxin
MDSTLKYDCHIFVCNNQRPEGAPRPCCGEANGLALVAAFKKEVKDKNLPIRVRAQRTGCFDFCEKGPVVALYPEGVFYGNVKMEDVPVIVDQHIAGGKKVDRLIF